MITAEHWMEGINSVLDEYGLSREEFWKDPKAFLDNLDDMDAKLTLEYFMEVCRFRIAALKWSFATPANLVHLKRRCGNFGWTEG